MKCRHIKRAIKSLVCGDKADVESIQAHLSECSRCAERYAQALSIARSAESIPVPPVDGWRWKEFSAQLHGRIRQEHPASLSAWRSFLLRLGEWKLLRFRKAAAASIATLALAMSLIAFLSHNLPQSGEPEFVERTPPPTEPTFPELPPDMEDVISIFGDGFITGVLDYGYIQPGDFYGGHELGVDSTIEALDFLFFPS